MSNVEHAPQREFDFWDYVSCSRCHLSFTPDDGGPPPVPFWVTECGHVICNNHLKTDQSCVKCGRRDVQVGPLQRNMDPPMSNWFTSIPQAFDTLAFATRFQIETLADLVRYYKKKCVHQRSLIDRMKPAVQENNDLRRALEELQAETYQSQGYMEPSDLSNNNGKRQMQLMHSGAHTNSSPRSLVTPMGPNRLTLPPSHQQSGFAPRQHYSDDGPQPRRQRISNRLSEDLGFGEEMNRPGSRRFSEQYAYVPSSARQGRSIPAQNLPYNQLDPVRQAQGRRQLQPPVQNEAHIPTQIAQGESNLAALRPPQQQSARQLQKQHQDGGMQMPPPQAPQSAPDSSRHGRLQQRGGFMPPPATPRGLQSGQPLNRRLLNATPLDQNAVMEPDFSNFRAATPALQTRRFMPPTPSGGQHFTVPSSSVIIGSSSLGSSLIKSGSTASMSGGGQRLPFVPGGQPSGP